MNMIGHLDLIKKINRSLILEKIKTDQPISRATIAKRLSLSKSTVSTIVDELLEKKLVIELGEQTATKGGGRPALMIGFNPKSAYAIGVDIDRQKIVVLITDLVGAIVYRKKLECTNQIDELVSIIKNCLSDSNIAEDKIIGMGIGVPGITDTKTVFSAKALRWTNLNVHQLISKQFAFPVFINNDVNCAGLGEMWLGSGRNSNHLFFIEIGMSIGSAIISNGNLVYGYNYQSGEIAYQMSKGDFEQKRFNLPNGSGVFENKVSGTALAGHGMSIKALFERYANGDSEVVPVVDNFIVELSIAIANAVNLLNPERVIIGGDVSEYMGVVMNEIQKMVDNLTPIRTNIRLASLGSDAGPLGAISFAFKQIEHS
ncbi:ROK family transcriptional regulator [Sporolactobacillus terrae]|uniref:ROK family transcriptional regulator n=1 Tax=Sporolactobacillus terrae TaxID=269673 RepID=UPI00048C3539|nr:ROK family transcriptional regulator [Sporolactobacillus terrae]